MRLTDLPWSVRTAAPQPRLLIIPGLHDSGPGHWQSWLQHLHPDAVRVTQHDWARPDLPRWSEQIARTLAAHDPRQPWVAVAHSFGCLALAHHLGLMLEVQRQARRHGQTEPPVRAGIAALLMAAPASPDKFGLRHLLPAVPLQIVGTLVASSTDPWMSEAEAAQWAADWALDFHLAGEVGHINVDSGHGPWPLAAAKVAALL